MIESLSLKEENIIKDTRNLQEPNYTEIEDIRNLFSTQEKETIVIKDYLEILRIL